MWLVRTGLLVRKLTLVGLLWQTLFLQTGWLEQTLLLQTGLPEQILLVITDLLGQTLKASFELTELLEWTLIICWLGGTLLTLKGFFERT